MAVDVEGDIYGGVAQHLLYYLAVFPAGKHQCREGVSEVVETKGVGETGAFEKGFEGSSMDIVTVQRRAFDGTEYQPVILPKPRKS